MATGDPDGRIAEMIFDRQACLGIELSEWARELTSRMQAILPKED